MSLGKAIELIAEEKNLTVYRISKNSGIAQTTLGEIIRGKNRNPTFITLGKIAKGLDVSLLEIVKKMESLKDI